MARSTLRLDPELAESRLAGSLERLIEDIQRYYPRGVQTTVVRIGSPPLGGICAEANPQI
jgi:hypothetical protein